MNRNPKSTKNLLIIVTVLVWIAAIATSAGKFKMAAKAAVNISLVAKPSAVKILINNEKKFDGQYVETPQLIKVPSGKSKVKVSREGYISAVFTVDAAPGETINMNDVVLQKNPDLQFQTLEITTDEDEEPLYTSLNNGFISGETPITTFDAVAGSTYVMTVYPSWPEKEGSTRCRIKIPPAKKPQEDTSSFLQSDVLQVSVKRSARNAKVLSFKGCDKLKNKTTP